MERPRRYPRAIVETRDYATWLRRAWLTLGAVAAVLVVTGLYLTFTYRPASRVDAPGVHQRSWLVGAAHLTHAVGGYLFALVVVAVVALALTVVNQRHHGVGVIATSGIALVMVAFAFIVTGRQLPWRGFVWVASGLEQGFDGIIGFPAAVRAVLVGGGQTTPARYETSAWIHIAGLPVFAVFAGWWMLGSLQASAHAEARDPDAAARRAGPAPSPDEGPLRTVGLAEQIFGTNDPDTVKLQVDTFLQRHLQAGLASLEFSVVSIGIVLGVGLTDGRRVVVKIHAPGTDAKFLRAVQDVESYLSVQQFPAPLALLGPQPFGVGLATVETLLDAPPPADPTDRETRRALAEGLAEFVRLAAPFARQTELKGRGLFAPVEPGSAFSAPHGPQFDFAASSVGAEWIDEIAFRARRFLEAAPAAAPAVGHFDWRLENVPVSQGRIVAVYDWDSLGIAPEAMVVGANSHAFTVDWRNPEPHVPTLADVADFVADYQAARGKEFTPPERVAARTAYVYATAYGARCEHALAVTGGPAPTGYRERLQAHGAALLG